MARDQTRSITFAANRSNLFSLNHNVAKITSTDDTVYSSFQANPQTLKDVSAIKAKTTKEGLTRGLRASGVKALSYAWRGSADDKEHNDRRYESVVCLQRHLPKMRQTQQICARKVPSGCGDYFVI